MPSAQASFGRRQGHRRNPYSGRSGRFPIVSARTQRAVERSSSIARMAIQNSQRRRANFIHSINEASRTHPIHHNPMEDVLDSQQPKIDMFIDEVGKDAFKFMTPFRQGAFERMWHIIGPEFEQKWNTGKGPSTSLTPKDAVFIMLNVLSRPTTWDKHGIDFGVKGPTLQKQIWKAMCIFAPIAKREFQPKASMAQLRKTDVFFDNFPEALYATDAHFIHTDRPYGRHEESKPYFSGKHHLYGMKVEASVMPTGLACNWTDPVPAGEHDKAIFDNNLRFHLNATKKTAAEMAEIDHGEGARRHPDMWAILQDMAYYGVEDDVRSIHPKKQIRGNPLPYDDIERNNNIAHDRVLPENFFGRGVNLFPGSLGQRYVMSRSRLGIIVDICFSLTNFHIMLYPLRAQDGDYYKRTMADLRKRGEDNANKGKVRQQQYRRRMMERDGALAGVDDDDDDDTSLPPTSRRVSPSSSSSGSKLPYEEDPLDEVEEEDVVPTSGRPRGGVGQRRRAFEEDDEDEEDDEVLADVGLHKENEDGNGTNSDGLESDYGVGGPDDEKEDEDGAEATRLILEKAMSRRSVKSAADDVEYGNDDDDDNGGAAKVGSSFVSRYPELKVGNGSGYSTEEAEFDGEEEEGEQVAAGKDDGNNEAGAVPSKTSSQSVHRRSKRLKTSGGGDEAAKAKYGSDFVASV